MRLRVVDRHEPSVAMLVAVWTVAFLLRSRLAAAERLTDTGNEALLSLLVVIPVMLLSWGALAFADRRFGLGLFRPRRRR
jgi:uncharacterized membrane protein YhaH (DUF805 family)